MAREGSQLMFMSHWRGHIVYALLISSDRYWGYGGEIFFKVDTLLIFIYLFIFYTLGYILVSKCTLHNKRDRKFLFTIARSKCHLLN